MSAEEREGRGVKGRSRSSRASRDAWDDLYSRQPRTWRGGAVGPSGIPDGGTVLELGCGTGKTLASLHGTEMVIAIDFSKEAIAACRLRRLPDGAEMVQGDAASLPVRDSVVDGVIAHHLLGHLLSQERRMAVAEMRRVLVPGGAVSVRVLSRDDMRCGKGREIEPMTFMKGTGVFCHFFDEGELVDLFSHFEVRRVEREGTEKRYEGRRMLRSEIVAELTRPATD